MQVENVHRFASGYHGRSGTAASIETDEGDRLAVSRYDDETQWIVDGFWPASRPWFPVYWNGEGSRCTRLKVPSDPAVVAALDVAAKGC